jgi:membrane protease YdiL (CAAX protease family)
MGALVYVLAVVGVLYVGQTLLLLRFKQPLKWTFGATDEHSKKLRLSLKVLLQGTLISSIFLYPYLIGSRPGAYYGPMLPGNQAHLFVYGQVFAFGLLAVIYAIEMACGWIYWKARFPVRTAAFKSAKSMLSSLTVVAIEESFFRGIVLFSLLAAMATWPALLLGASVFSGAHFLRRVPTYWPFWGLAVLGLWLGVAFVKTDSLWLPMGLHSGGILSIGIHRCFLNYRAPEWLVGTQTFPIAGIISMLVMLVGTWLTWTMWPSPQ